MTPSPDLLDNSCVPRTADHARTCATLARRELLSSLPDRLLALVARNLPREMFLQLRLFSRDLCNRLSALMSDPRMSHEINFSQRFCVPTTLALDGVRDLPRVLCRLCSRFAVDANAWALRLDVRMETRESFKHRFWCGGVRAPMPQDADSRKTGRAPRICSRTRLAPFAEQVRVRRWRHVRRCGSEPVGDTAHRIRCNKGVRAPHACPAACNVQSAT